MSTLKRFASLILLFCASTAAACSDGVSPEDSAEVSVDPVSVLGNCDKISGGANYTGGAPFGDIDCGETITVETVGASSSERTEASAAANALADILDGQDGLPTLVFDGDEQSADHVIEVRFEDDPAGSGSNYYGWNSIGSNVVNIVRTNLQFPNTPGGAVTVQIGKVNQVVLHEMVQNFFFKEKNFTNLENCAIEVEYPPGLSNNLCVHEEQTIYYVFGLRADDVDLSQSMLTGLNLSPSSLSLEPTDIANITATICESGSTCGGAQVVMGTEFESVEGTANSVEGPASSVEGTANVVIPQVISWDDPSNPAVVSLTDRTDAGAKVTALSEEGNATISASLSPGPRVVWPAPPPAVVDVAVSEPCTVAFSPSSADIEIGEIEIFTATQFCSGITASLTPTNGSVGFSQGTACTLTSVSAQGLVKVRGCQEGPATLTIRQDGVVVQTINIDVVPPPPPVVASVSTSPLSVILNATVPERLVTATAYDQHGAPMSGVSFNWAKSSPWILLSGTGNTRTVSGCNNPPLPFYGSLTVTAAGTNVSKTISVRIHASYPHACIF